MDPIYLIHEFKSMTKKRVEHRNVYISLPKEPPEETDDDVGGGVGLTIF